MYNNNIKIWTQLCISALAGKNPPIMHIKHTYEGLQHYYWRHSIFASYLPSVKYQYGQLCQYIIMYNIKKISNKIISMVGEY